MKKIEAFWEKKNLSLNTLELEFDEKDSIEIINTIKEFEEYDYIAAKVPKGKVDFIHKLETKKFHFMEAQIELINNLKQKNEMPNRLLQTSNNIHYVPVKEEIELEMILNKIDSNMFDTDRISLDSYLGKELAAARYINWIRNLFYREDSMLCKLIHEEREIGFFLFKKINEKIYSSVLVGLYTEFKNKGLGFSVVEQHILWAVENHVEQIVTRVSSNNLRSLKLHLNFGYEIKDIYYVFRRINKI